MMPGLSIGAVVASYPSGNSVDVLLNDGSRLANVQVMTWTGSTNTGAVDLPDIGGPLDDTRWVLTSTFERYVRGVIGFLSGVPVCVGFLLPQVSQMTFDEKNRRVTRHASDVYTTVDALGNFELFHPSGTYLRIGSTAAHEDLTGKDYDGLWKIANNTASAPYVHLGVSNAGSPVASLDFDPSGNVTLQANGNATGTIGGNMTATVTGNLEADVTGTTTINSTGAATLKAPTVKIDSPQTTCTGALIVEGLLTFQAGASGSGGSGGGPTMTLAGNAQVNGSINSTGDQVAGGVSQISHVHGGVQSGGSQTTPPV